MGLSAELHFPVYAGQPVRNWLSAVLAILVSHRAIGQVTATTIAATPATSHSARSSRVTARRHHRKRAEGEQEGSDQSSHGFKLVPTDQTSRLS